MISRDDNRLFDVEFRLGSSGGGGTPPIIMLARDRLHRAAIAVAFLVGFWITMFLVPARWYWVLLGFVLFRFFDMVKPWPISWIDRKVHGGVGIMLDDILAGLAAAGCLHVVVIFTSL